MLFLPKDESLANLAKKVVEDVVEKEGHCHVVGWRDVPVVHEVVGRMARDAEPRIVQVHALSASWRQDLGPVFMCDVCLATLSLCGGEERQRRPAAILSLQPACKYS